MLAGSKDAAAVENSPPPSGCSAVAGEARRPVRQWPLRKWLAGVIDLIFPPACSVCGKFTEPGEGGESRYFSSPICGGCEQSLSESLRRLCDRCAMPTTTLETTSCPDCRERRSRLTQTRVLGLYEGPLRQAVLRMKHAEHESLAVALGELLARKIATAPLAETPDLVAPIPMHWLRRAWRGTSSAASLAVGVARGLGLPLAGDLLTCRRFIKRQTALARGERLENVRHAYRVAWNYDIRGAAILLVDDVVTTGATSGEAARMLLDSGARSVSLAAAARGTGVT